MFTQIFQQILNGLVLGSTYALFALGFTLMFGVLRVINLTYGFYFTIGAFFALYSTSQLLLPLWFAVLLSPALSGIAAMLIDHVLLTPLRRRRAPELASLMVTLGATLLLYSLMTAFFGTEIHRLPSNVISRSAVLLGTVRVGVSQLLIVVSTIGAVIVLLMIMKFTRFGLAMRALSENETATQLMGVNADAIVRLVSFISGSLGGLAGVLIGLNFNAIQPYMGESMMLKGFAVIIIGGLGDVPGALLAGLLVGILEVVTAGFISSNLKDAVGFILLVGTLWARPAGLFGHAQIKRA